MESKDKDINQENKIKKIIILKRMLKKKKKMKYPKTITIIIAMRIKIKI